jgi:flavin reductase (DIM6/NTAB) family NADH-FMN oxidoreductase RutF
MASNEFVLQLLGEQQYNLIKLLGQQSGHQTNKIERLSKRKLLTEWNDFPVLKDAIAVMHLKVISLFNAGDHTAVLCDVLSYKNLNEGAPLTLDILRQQKLIRS